MIYKYEKFKRKNEIYVFGTNKVNADVNFFYEIYWIIKYSNMHLIYKEMVAPETRELVMKQIKDFLDDIVETK